ncbi:MAG: valine--tRNA ligase [Candidatus Aenigmarchaeota archaeon]|nr:valine--tRNA ligase [Candidatus Aenigmarchaeota archaeon]
MARYKRMKGFSVHFPQGWDVHGLPTESKVEKWKGKKSSEVDRQQWCEWCEQWTLEHIVKMKEMINRLGISIDWSFEYKTSDPAYIRMIQLSFLDLIKKGYAYRGRHPVNWCTNCLTAIADAEVEKIERDTKLYTIKFRLAGQGEIEIATTRPEYLCSCVGILINPDDQRAKKLINKRAIVPLFEQEVEIIPSKTADPNFGTGMLMVCTFGDKDDVSDVIKHKLPILDTIDEKGKLTHIANKYKGLGVVEARKTIVEDLKLSSLLVKEESLKQNIGTCWRCKTPIEILNKEQWFVRATEFNNNVIRETEKAKWRPAYMAVRQIQWAQSMDWDWVVSRQKVYGTPIPVWYCENNECAEVIPALEEELPVDPEKKNKKCPRCGSGTRPEIDRFDTWFDSSMTTYRHAGWPDNKEWKKFIPASLQPNGIDIIRTWDYYLMVRSLMATGLPAYENILINGMVLGEDGRKMSKSLGNYVTAEDIFEKSSVDAVRYWATTAATGNNLPFSWKELLYADKFFIKLTNIANFVFMHVDETLKQKKIDNIDRLADLEDLEYLDKWILTELQKLVADITDDFEHYNFSMTKIIEFIWHEFADHYMEMVKYRIFSGYKKDQAVWTLYKCLNTFVKLLAPFVPFVTEEIYKTSMERFENNSSVHLAEWPSVDESLIDERAEELGKLAKDIMSAVRQYKTANKLPLNAPLKEIIIEEDGSLPLIEDIKGTLKIEKVVTGKVSEEDIITDKFNIKIKIIA